MIRSRVCWMLTVIAAVTAPALTAQEAPPVTLSGEVRFRGEWDGRTAAVGDDAAVLSRMRMGVTTEALPWVTAFVQLQDARAWGTETDPTEGTADQFDLHQGYVDLTRENLTLRIGRQEVTLGDERLIGPLGWANTARAFDGILARQELAAGHVRVFWMNVAERDALTVTGVNPQVNEGDDDDGWLLGAFLTRPVGRGALELIALHDRNAATDESYTLYARLHGGTDAILFDGSAAYQFGPDRGAYVFSALVGVPLDRSGRVVGQLDYLSGDAQPFDATRRAFQTLYPTAHAYHGYMDYFLTFPGNSAAAGLVDAMARVTLPTTRSWRLRADVHYFALAAQRTGGRQLGIETDVIASRSMARGADVEIGASAFLPDDRMSAVAPAFAAEANATYWGYAMLTVGW